MTPFWSHSFGMRRRGSAVTYDPWFSGANTDLLHYFGANAEELYLPGEPASGNIVGKIAGNVLSPVTSPLYQQALTGAANDPLGAGFDNGTTDSFDAATSAVHDVAGDAFAILVPAYLPASVSSGSILGKTNAAVQGYRIHISSGPKISAKLYDNAGGGQAWTTADAVPVAEVFYAVLWRSIVLSTSGVLTSAGETTVDSTTMQSLANASAFALGSCSSYTATGIVLGPVAIWSGAAAETVIANRATTLPAWWAEATA